jgi:hypothetical protein
MTGKVVRMIAEQKALPELSNFVGAPAEPGVDRVKSGLLSLIQ